MSKIAEKLTDLIGNTPLLKLNKFSENKGLKTPIIAKLEYFNPAGSVKDRAAFAMILDAEKKGLIKPGDTLIEPTSGNTGVGLAFVSAVRGYKLVLTMPDSMSIERRKLLAAYGACIELTPAADGMKGAVAKAEELRGQIPHAVILQQFENAANPDIHYHTTAEEIWCDTEGHIDVFVAGVGTGGTVSGVGKRLKELNPNIQVFAVEPAGSPILSAGSVGPHKIQGIGANFIPKNYNPDVVDGVITVENEDAFATSRFLAIHEGLLVGISSGAAAYCAALLAKRPENVNKNIVVLLPDTGERYLSTELFG